MFNKFIDNFKSKKKKTDLKFIAIDIGTSKTSIYIQGKGIVFDEPSILCYKKNEVLCLGKDASSLFGKRFDSDLEFKYLFFQGTFTKITILKDFFQKVLERYELKEDFKDSLVVYSLPTNIKELDKKQLDEIFTSLGATYAEGVYGPCLSLLEYGIDPLDHKARLVIDMGAGRTNISVICDLKIISNESINVGGDWINYNIRKSLKSLHNIEISDLESERIKKQFSDLSEKPQKKELEVFGSDISTSFPKKVVISSSELQTVLNKFFIKVTDVLKKVITFEDKPLLSEDIINNGAYVTGGLSKIKGIKNFLESSIKLKIKVSKKGDKSVLCGAILFQKFLFKHFENVNL